MEILIKRATMHGFVPTIAEQIRPGIAVWHDPEVLRWRLMHCMTGCSIGDFDDKAAALEMWQWMEDSISAKRLDAFILGYRADTPAETLTEKQIKRLKKKAQYLGHVSHPMPRIPSDVQKELGIKE